MKTYILKNQLIEVWISDLGAIIQRLMLLNKNGNFEDVVLGFDTMEAYTDPDYLANYPYLGAVMGRFANRIGGASFEIDGETFHLANNAGQDHLHGGAVGFDRKIWTVEQHEAERLVLSYISPDGEEGYPGNLSAKIEFTLRNRSLWIRDEAVCDKKCFVNITHHPYFNLYQQDTNVGRHHLQIFSDRYLETDHLIPTGKIIPCASEHHFERPKPLSPVIADGQGLDHTYLFSTEHRLQPMAILSHPEVPYQLEIRSDLPSMQVYTGAFLNVKHGKTGDYQPFSGIAFEPQKYPDAPHHLNFPSALLSPGERYEQTIVYCFSDISSSI